MHDVCVFVEVCAGVHMWKSGDNFGELFYFPSSYWYKVSFLFFCAMRSRVAHPWDLGVFLVFDSHLLSCCSISEDYRSKLLYLAFYRFQGSSWGHQACMASAFDYSETSWWLMFLPLIFKIELCVVQADFEYTVWLVLNARSLFQVLEL